MTIIADGITFVRKLDKLTGGVLIPAARVAELLRRSRGDINAAMRLVQDEDKRAGAEAARKIAVRVATQRTANRLAGREEPVGPEAPMGSELREQFERELLQDQNLDRDREEYIPGDEFDRDRDR